MSVNCIKCVVNRRTGVDLLCDTCRNSVITALVEARAKFDDPKTVEVVAEAIFERLAPEHIERWADFQEKERYRCAAIGAIVAIDSIRSPTSQSTLTPELCGHIGGDASGAISTVCQQPKGHIGKHGGMGCEWSDGATPRRIPQDKGRRYELQTDSPLGGKYGVAGWHDDLSAAIKLADSFSKHPEANLTRVIDRANRFECVYERKRGS